MRVAISGTQCVGKSTLIEQLSTALPDYEVVDEPYLLLEDEGHDFAHPPTAEDFEAQLVRSIAEVRRSGPNVLLDRSPADFLGYLLAGGDDIDEWVDRAATAMARLDLVVLVPIEAPDRIAVPSDEDLDQRRSVDEEIAQLLIDEELAANVVTVHGDVDTRVAQVLAHLR